MTLERDPLEPWHMGANVDAPAVAPVDEVRTAAAIQLLEGNEIVQLSIKPSLWFIAIVSMRFSLTALGMATILGVMAATRLGWSTAVVYAFDALLMAALARVLVASLQWASSAYVLTNRRVMRLSGVFTVIVTQCPLARVGQVSLHTAPVGNALSIGSIRLSPRDDRLDTVNWEHLARPNEIHDILSKAVRRSQ